MYRACTLTIGSAWRRAIDEGQRLGLGCRRARARRPRRSSTPAARCAASVVSSPPSTTPSSRILMLTSWSLQSTPAELSMASVLTSPPASAYSTRPSWVSPRLPPSPTIRQRSSAPSTRTRVVGPVADVGVGLGRRLDVGADAAVPQQVDGSPQHRRHQLVRRQRPVRRAEHGARLRAQLDRLRRARVDAAAGRDAAPRRSRPSSSGAARTGAAARRTTTAGSGSGSRNTWRWSNAATSAQRAATAASRCRTRRRTCRRCRPRSAGRGRRPCRARWRGGARSPTRRGP